MSRLSHLGRHSPKFVSRGIAYAFAFALATLTGPALTGAAFAGKLDGVADSFNRFGAALKANSEFRIGSDIRIGDTDYSQQFVPEGLSNLTLAAAAPNNFTYNFNNNTPVNITFVPDATNTTITPSGRLSPVRYSGVNIDKSTDGGLFAQWRYNFPRIGVGLQLQQVPVINHRFTNSSNFNSATATATTATYHVDSLGAGSAEDGDLTVTATADGTGTVNSVTEIDSDSTELMGLIVWNRPRGVRPYIMAGYSELEVTHRINSINVNVNTAANIPDFGFEFGAVGTDRTYDFDELNAANANNVINIPINHRQKETVKATKLEIGLEGDYGDNWGWVFGVSFVDFKVDDFAYTHNFEPAGYDVTYPTADNGLVGGRVDSVDPNRGGTIRSRTDIFHTGGGGGSVSGSFTERGEVEVSKTEIRFGITYRF